VAVIPAPERLLPGATLGKPGRVAGEEVAENPSLLKSADLTFRTRLTNGFSKKVENLEHMVALHLMHYDFVRIHKSLHTTPAMAEGVSKMLWSIADIAALVADPVPAKRESYKR